MPAQWHEVLVENSSKYETDFAVQFGIKVLEEVIYLDDALTCEVSITVTGKLGPLSASASGKVSGPCDEVQAAAAALLKSLIQQVKDELNL